MNIIPEKTSAGTGEWSPGPMVDKVDLLGVRVGAWNHFEYAPSVPPLGERNADAIKAGHGAIKVIDEIIRDLHALRNQLIIELRTDEDVRGRRVDAMLAEARAERCPDCGRASCTGENCYWPGGAGLRRDGAR
jgi:hypothetical protein